MMLMRVNTHREFGITYTPNLQHEPCLAALLRDSNWVNIRFWFHTPLWICHPQHKTKSLNKSDRRHTTEVAEQAQTQYLRSCLCKPLGSSPTTDDDDDESHPLPSLPEIWIPTKLHKTLNSMHTQSLEQKRSTEGHIVDIPTVCSYATYSKRQAATATAAVSKIKTTHKTLARSLSLSLCI